MNTRIVLVVFYSLFALATLFRVGLYHSPSALEDGASISQIIRVESQTSFKDTYHSFRTHIEGVEVRVVVDRYTAFDQGELVKLTGSIKNTVLDNDQTMSSIYHPEIHEVSDSSFLYRLRIGIRERVRDAYDTFLPPDESHLLMGIVFGINSGFSSKLTETFSTTGVMHVIAASGMNVTLLGGFVSSILARYLRRRTALIGTIVVLVFYAFLAGLGSSIVRATIMGIVAFGAGIFGRQNTAKLALLTTGLVMLTISPELLYDVGFQLSFAATAGIMWLKASIPQVRGDLGKLINEDLGSTLSAQLATFPIILFYFHSVGVFSPIINLLVLWIVPPVMVIGLCAAVVGLVSPIIGGVLSLGAWPFLSYFLIVVREGSKLSPSVMIESLPASLIVAYYLILFCIYKLLSRKGAPHVRS